MKLINKSDLGLSIGSVLLVLLMNLAQAGAKDRLPPGGGGDASRFYVYWGYNRAWYSKSDIHFKGDGYDFELADIEAKDRPSELTFKNYFYFTSWSVPQTNIKVGYNLTDKTSLAVGMDHMKYVMNEDQISTINGAIHVGNRRYDGEYVNQEIQMRRSFLTFEHTDGLNYFFAEFNRSFKLLNRGSFQLNSILGISPGFLRPRTDVRFLGVQGPNRFHISGYGINGKLGIDSRFFDNLSLVSEIKAGYINMPRIQATSNGHDLVSQSFGFLQANLTLGYVFGTKKE